MRSRLLIPLLLGSLGSLGACALSTETGEPFPGPNPRDVPDAGSDSGTPTEPIPPSPEAKALLAEWSGCMSLDDFTGVGMAIAWSRITSADGGACTQCHSPASRSFPVSSDAKAFFTVLSEHSASMLLLFSVDLKSTPHQVIADPSAFLVAASGMAPYAQHPRFSIEGAPKGALFTFQSATEDRKAAGVCGPPRLLD